MPVIWECFIVYLCKIFFSRSLIPFTVSPHRRFILQEYDIRLDPCLGIKIFQPVCQISVMIDKPELIKIPVRIGNGPGDRCALSAWYRDFRVLGWIAAGLKLVKEPYDDNEQDYERKAASPASSAGAAPAGETPVDYRTAPPAAGPAEMRSAEVRPAGAGAARASAAAESAAGAPAKRLPSGMSSSAVWTAASSHDQLLLPVMSMCYAVIFFCPWMSQWQKMMISAPIIKKKRANNNCAQRK